MKSPNVTASTSPSAGFGRIASSSVRRGMALLALAVVAISGCGSSSSSSGNPLNQELSYFPSNAPFVLSIQTDPNSTAVKQAQQLEARFPTAAAGQAALTAKLQQLGINYSTDIRPLFGNQVMFGIAGTGLSGSARSEFLAVWITKDAGKLNSLAQKLFHGQPSSGSHDGAKLYSVGTATFAIDGPTLVIGANQTIVQNALDLHAHGGGFTSGDYNRDVSGLPKSTLIQAFGNLTSVLSTPRAAQARAVPWVGALRGYAAAITVSTSGVSFQYHLDTTGRSLSPSQLPIAAGTSAPALAGALPIVAAVKNPSQVVSFVESAMQAASPTSYQKFQQQQAAARAKTGVDVNTLLSQLTGDLVVASDTHATLVRATVSNPSSVATTLSKLATYPPAFSPSATKVTRFGGYYVVQTPSSVLAVGLIGNQLVAGSKTSPAQLNAFATAPATPASSQGAVAFRIALPALLQNLLRSAASSLPLGTVLGHIGNITGSLSASTSGLTGSANLGIH